MIMTNYNEMKEYLKKGSALTGEVFEDCLNLAYEDSHSFGYGEVCERFKDLEEIFIKVYNIGYKDGYYGSN